ARVGRSGRRDFRARRTGQDAAAAGAAARAAHARALPLGPSGRRAGAVPPHARALRRSARDRARPRAARARTVDAAAGLRAPPPDSEARTGADGATGAAPSTV